VWLILGTALLLLSSAHADDVIDNVDVTVGTDYAEIRVKLAIAANYVRHFPLDSGQIIEVYIQPISLDGFELPTRSEIYRSHAPNTVPCFSIGFTPLNRPLSLREAFPLVIRFGEPVHFKLTGGHDNHGFSLRIPLVAGATPPASRRRCPD